tara:strand:- start:106 stop:243 length:138 start_codon:yes stop_codon:yes gene_type:complete
MAKRKSLIGINTFHKRTKKKRPGRIRKKWGPKRKKPKKYRGQGKK